MLADHYAEMEQAVEEQAVEGSRLEKLKEEVEAAPVSHTKHVSKETPQLEAREKTLAVAEKARHDAFASFE